MLDASYPERRLLEEAQSGDEPAFAALLERHQKAIYGYLHARLWQPADAEDLCQEVFLRCYQGRAGSLPQGVSLRAWLLGVARRVLLEHARKVGRRKEIVWTELCLELDSAAPPPDNDRGEQLDQLQRCLETLGPSAREALEMRYSQQMPLAEIGRRMRRSEGAVKLLMHRARLALKHCLERYF